MLITGRLSMFNDPIVVMMLIFIIGGCVSIANSLIDQLKKNHDQNDN